MRRLCLLLAAIAPARPLAPVRLRVPTARSAPAFKSLATTARPAHRRRVALAMMREIVPNDLDADGGADLDRPPGRAAALAGRAARFAFAPARLTFWAAMRAAASARAARETVGKEFEEMLRPSQRSYAYPSAFDDMDAPLSLSTLNEETGPIMLSARSTLRVSFLLLMVFAYVAWPGYVRGIGFFVGGARGFERLKAITGWVFAPAVATLFGTLTSFTISLLTQRQARIQQLVAEEAATLGLLARHLLDLFSDADEDMRYDRPTEDPDASAPTLRRALRPVWDHTACLVCQTRNEELVNLVANDPCQRVLSAIAEAQQPGNCLDPAAARARDAARALELAQPAGPEGKAGDKTASSAIVRTSSELMAAGDAGVEQPRAIVRGEGQIVQGVATIQALVDKLSSQRSLRLSEEALALPPAHFSVLAVLGSMLLLSFGLIAGSEGAAILAPKAGGGQLRGGARLLFSALVGCYALVAHACLDLNQPFAGRYQVRKSVPTAMLLQIRKAVFSALPERDRDVLVANDGISGRLAEFKVSKYPKAALLLNDDLEGFRRMERIEEKEVAAAKEAAESEEKTKAITTEEEDAAAATTAEVPEDEPRRSMLPRPEDVMASQEDDAADELAMDMDDVDDDAESAMLPDTDPAADDGFDDFDDGLAPRSRDASVDDAQPQDFQDADWARGSWAQDDLDLSDESVWNLPGPASADADAEDASTSSSTSTLYDGAGGFTRARKL